MALLSQILKNFQDSRDSLGNLFQDHTTLPVEKLFLISNLNLPNCSLKPLALVITLGTTKRSIFIYQCQYNLPAAFFFFQCHLWQPASQGKNCFSFGEGHVSRMSWGEVSGFNLWSQDFWHFLDVFQAFKKQRNNNNLKIQ